MDKKRFHYNKAMLVEALMNVGIKKGDIIFSHVAMGMLGYPEEGRTEKDAFQVILDAYLSVIGKEGTLLVPTYSYSFCKGEDYDPDLSPSDVGPFTDFFRTLPDVKRSLDPIFSVAALGAKSADLLEDLPKNCFAQDCIYDRLCKTDAKICNIGLGLNYATFLHHVEQLLNVPYRFRKIFTGYIKKGGMLHKESWVYNVRVLQDNCKPDFMKLSRHIKEIKKCNSTYVGRGEVISIGCKEFFNICYEKIIDNDWILAKGPKADILELENIRVPPRIYHIDFPVEPKMMGIIQTIYGIPRDIVSDGYDAALHILTKIAPIKIHKYLTGSEFGKYIVPEKWSCHEGYIETVEGEKIIDYKDNPMHIASYSSSHSGIVTKDELIKHLYTIPEKPGAIPSIFKYYDVRDWGLCCSENIKNTLIDARYKVQIKSDLSYGELKTGEMMIPGISDDQIIFYANLCPSMMVNNGLSGVMAGLEIMKRLRSRKLYYTYRLLIVPEIIGAIAWLNKNREIMKSIKSLLFINMLGTNLPYSFGRSYREDNDIDKTFSETISKYNNSRIIEHKDFFIKEKDSFHPVPVISLIKSLPPDNKDFPYFEYDTSLDNLSIVSEENLSQSIELILNCITDLEIKISG